MPRTQERGPVWYASDEPPGRVLWVCLTLWLSGVDISAPARARSLANLWHAVKRDGLSPLVVWEHIRSIVTKTLIAVEHKLLSLLGNEYVQWERGS